MAPSSSSSSFSEQQQQQPFVDQLIEAHDEVIRHVLEPVKEVWRQMQEESPWEAVKAFVHAVDWKVRARA